MFHYPQSMMRGQRYEHLGLFVVERGPWHLCLMQRADPRFTHLRTSLVHDGDTYSSGWLKNGVFVYPTGGIMQPSHSGISYCTNGFLFLRSRISLFKCVLMVGRLRERLGLSR